MRPRTRISTRTRSRWWLPGGGSHHPFLYRRADDRVIDLRVQVDAPVIDLTVDATAQRSPVRRRRVDPFVAARRTPSTW